MDLVYVPVIIVNLRRNHIELLGSIVDKCDIKLLARNCRISYLMRKQVCKVLMLLFSEF